MKRRNIILLVLAGLVVVYVGYRLSLRLAVQSRLDAIHRAGYPATCAELDKWYRQPPTGENAADVFREAFARYEAWTNEQAQLPDAEAEDKSKYYSPPKTKRDLLPVVGFAKLPARTEPLPAEMPQIVAAYLTANAEALRLLHHAASMKSCRFPVDPTQGLATLLPHLSPLRQAARLLALEAIKETAEQRPQEAVESVIASLGVSRSLNHEPWLISHLVHIACQGIAFDSLERILNRMSLTDEQLTTLAAAIGESKDPQSLTRAFVGERCMGLDAFEGLRTGKTPLSDSAFGVVGEASPWVHPLALLYRATGLLDLDERTYLDVIKHYVNVSLPLTRESVASARKARREQLASFATIQAIWSLGGSRDAGIDHLPRYCILSRLLLPALDAVVTKEARYDAKLHDAQMALAVERYRLANGELPNQLSDLVPAFVPAVPADSFDGNPLRYKRLATGYVVYSVGDDREDNNGAEKNSKGHSYEPGSDITFTIER